MNNGTLTAHVPTVLLDHLEEDPEALVRSLDGTVMFADVSGFTALSERLARAGREGAERLTDVINSCFTALLAEAYSNGASLIKFGGDALLLWFDGADHPARACTAAVAMRKTLRDIVREQLRAEKVVLRISIGVHSGRYQTFLVGGSHREYLIAGPAASAAVAMEGAASSSQILVSPATAGLLPPSCLGAACGPGVLLSRSPQSVPRPRREIPQADQDVVAACLSTELRAHLQAAPSVPEHRTATITFLQFGAIDELISGQGPDVAAEQLDEVVRIVQDAADHNEICFLGSDITAGGGKLLLSGGAPRAVGDDEERMLLALRQVIESQPRLPIRAGVNRGPIFAGDVGPHYRRTYTLMGDAVNLAARLMAKAPWGSIYSTEPVLARSRTRFATSAVPPFMVKGKSKPVHALDVGPAQRASTPGSTTKGLPLVGRDQEVAAIARAIAEAQVGQGGLIELVGETGSGKSRLIAEARHQAPEMLFIHATCEPYTKDSPYVAWRDPLRAGLGLGWDDTDDVVLEALRSELQRSQPSLLPWLPLLAIAVGVEAPMTREVRELAPESRAMKLHEVVLDFLASVLRVPTLVAIEHAHLMDEASAALLRALTGALGSSAWLVMVTRRDVEGGFVSPADNVTRLDLGPLSPADILALAEATPEAHVLPPHMIELAVERSGGSPEFLLDFLSAASGGSGVLPDSIEAAASARIDALDPSDRVLIRRAAVLGLSFPPQRLRHVLEPGADLPGEETWRRLSPIFAIDPDGHIRFKRPARCEVAHDGVPFRLRRELHAAVAESLERELGHDVDADPAILSLHFSLAGDHARARKYALIGAQRASARFAHADEAQLYRRAIEAGRHDQASPTELAGAWESLGKALQRTGELTGAAEAITVARGLVDGDQLAQGRLFYWHTVIAEHAARLTTAVRWGHRGLRMLHGLQQREAAVWRARTLARLAFYRGRQGRLLEAERLCHDAISEAESVGELEAQGYAYWTLDWLLFELGREAETGYSQRALEIYEQLGDLEQQGNVLNNLSVFAAERWKWDEALELLARSAACSERAGIHGGVAATEVNIAEIMIDRGLFDEAWPHLQRARRLWRSIGEPTGTAYVDVLLGRLAVRAERDREGLALLRKASQVLRNLGEQGYTEFADSSLAEAEAFAGDPESALAIADRLIRAAEPTDRVLALLHRIRALALARLSDDEAKDALAVSLALAREREALYDLAAGLDLAETLTWPDAERAQERDAILARLGIERLPTLPVAVLETPTVAVLETPAAAAAS